MDTDRGVVDWESDGDEEVTRESESHASRAAFRITARELGRLIREGYLTVEEC